MARKTARVTQVWTIREVGSNGFLGTYRTYTADQAIQNFWDGQAATAATFRRSQPMMRKFAVTATVEPVD